MKALRIVCTLMVLLLSISGAVNAAPPAPESIIGLTISPTPVIAGSTVYISWDMDLQEEGSAKFRLSIPADWYDATAWAAGTDVTVGADFNTWTDSVTACTTNAINGIPMICNEWETAALEGSGVESITVSFTVKADATLGSGRPVRAVNNAGSAGPPNIATVYVTVQGPPTTRYIANTPAACGANTPCDTGAGALQDAIDALPAAGGTIIVIGQHNSSGGAIGAKNIVLRPMDANAALQGSCSGTLVKLDGAGNLTVDGLRLVGQGAPGTTCFVGVGVTGDGNLTVQGATFTGWYGDGYDGGYGISITGGSGAHTINNTTFWANATGLNVNSTTATVLVNPSTFNANADGGVIVFAGVLTIENSVLRDTTPGYGLFQYGGNVTLRGNTFSNNASFAFVNVNGVMTAYANNITGNNDGGYQAYVSTLAAAAKNWWGDAHNTNVGPTSGSGPYAAGWNARLGASVKSWAAGVGSATLGAAKLTDGGAHTGVIMELGRGSVNAPFGNGVIPNVNQTCSAYFDFYALSGAAWKVHLPIDDQSDCVNNVLFQEVVYQIVDRGNCANPNDTACWQLIPNGQIAADSGNKLLVISGLDLSGTHIVAGDRNGLSPTSVTIASFEAAWQEDAVRVTWETAQEIDNLGFNVHRATASEGLWEQVNVVLVPAQAPGAVFGAAYEWVDTDVTPGETYLYRLEDVDIHGASAFHGPVSATPGGPTSVTLLAFGARPSIFGLALVFPLSWAVWRRRRG